MTVTASPSEAQSIDRDELTLRSPSSLDASAPSTTVAVTVRDPLSPPAGTLSRIIDIAGVLPLSAPVDAALRLLKSSELAGAMVTTPLETDGMALILVP